MKGDARSLDYIAHMPLTRRPYTPKPLILFPPLRFDFDDEDDEEWGDWDTLKGPLTLKP